MKVTKENFEKMLYYLLSHPDYGKFNLFQIRQGYYSIETKDGHSCTFFANMRDDENLEICFFKTMVDSDHTVMRTRKIEDVLIQINAWIYPVLGQRHYVQMSSFDWENLVTYGSVMGGMKTCFQRFIDVRNTQLCN